MMVMRWALARFAFEDPSGTGEDSSCVRVIQTIGGMAWSSLSWATCAKIR